jgi:hypothetical protein
MATLPIAKGLPTNYAASIGRIISRFSYAEWLVLYIVCKLLQIGPKHGRVAVRTPRVEDGITMIEQLMSLDKITVSLNTNTLKTSLKYIENERDMLAHGVWMRHPGFRTWHIQVTKGNWKPDPLSPKVSRRIKPEGREIKMAYLKDLRKKLETAIADLKQLSGQIDAVLNSLPQRSQKIKIIDQMFPGLLK